MATLRTPGVYVEEITKFPPSVAPVATAIPAFIGYTQKAEDVVANDLRDEPTRITSLLEYETYFGTAEDEDSITVDVNVDANDNEKIVVTNSTPSSYKMYYSMQMYFANGGGPCYIVSVGDYSASIDVATLNNGLAAIRKEDEPTLLLFPDATSLSSQTNFNSIYTSAIDQCVDLQDRFTILDTYTDSDTAIEDLRNGLPTEKDRLKYGAAYYPFLDTILDYQYEDADVTVNDGTTQASEAALDALIASFSTDGLESKIASLILKRDEIDGFTGGTEDADSVAEIPALQTIVNDINSELVALSAIVSEMIVVGNFESATTETSALQTWIDDLKANVIDALDAKMADIATQTTQTTILNRVSDSGTNLYTILGGAVGNTAADFDIIDTDIPAFLSTQVAALETAIDAPGAVATTLAALEIANNALYNRIKQAIADTPVTLPPSSAMAGVYARVDNNVGVWKAPANVSVSYVINPSVKISNEENGDMNVTSTGKSVNAIRTFTGKGTLVWGARTLAGNDNEWRYVPVRRFFNFVEESVSESVEAFVFEPNNSHTWVRVKSMIENFLNDQWKAGALAGAKPRDAFYVNIGLGSTMTSQDILEGRMIVEIGMAAVRPAEFIVLRFSHKMQES